MINPNGSSELIFIGIGEQKERYAKGLMDAVREALISAVDDPKLITKKVSSLCTDGVNVNTGEENGLWALMDNELKSADSEIPLLKIWCAAHRAELAWKSTARNVTEVTNALSMLSNMSTYFHYSPLRTSELKKIASDNELKLLAIPKIFEIRWSQFTLTIVRNVLVSWKALVLYFQANTNNAQCIAYLNYLTNLENMKLLAFLGGTLFCYQRFQKKLQSNQLTLIDMKRYVTAMVKSLKDMETTPLIGGFEKNLESKLIVDENDDKVYFKTIEMKTGNIPRNRREPKSFSEVRKNILECLQIFLTDRFKIDDELFEIIDPFVKFESSTDIEAIHSRLAPDLELASLSLQFQDISNNLDLIKEKSLNEVICHLSQTDASRESYKELRILLARIAACTPHSADVERCISANNILKTKNRTHLSIETECKYLYIRMNMPVLSEWNPTEAAKMFVEEKNRRTHDIKTGHEQSKRHYWFKAIFNEANKNTDDEDDTNDGAVEVDRFFEF